MYSRLPWGLDNIERVHMAASGEILAPEWPPKSGSFITRVVDVVDNSTRGLEGVHRLGVYRPLRWVHFGGSI